MEWLLVMVLMSRTEDMRPKPVGFGTRAECVAAAREFVERYSAFEFRDPSDKR